MENNNNLPDDFNAADYRLINRDLICLPDDQCSAHYVEHGIKENRMYKKSQIYEKLPKDFNAIEYKAFYKDINQLTDIEACIHYLECGEKRGRSYAMKSGCQELKDDDSIQYFVVCHDQNIIIDNIENNKFKNIPNLKFLFVGNKDCSLIENRTDVIILRKHPNNIEKYKNLCSYTAWNFVYANKLFNKKYLCFMEYDVDISDCLHSENLSYIKEEADAYYYVAQPVDHPVFYASTPFFQILIEETLKLNLLEFVENNKEDLWPSTTNIILKCDVFEKFIEWFNPMTHIFRKYKLGSYVQERAFFVFLKTQELKYKQIKNVLFHKQLASHENLDVYGYFIKEKKKSSIKFEDYDKWINYYLKYYKKIKKST